MFCQNDGPSPPKKIVYIIFSLKYFLIKFFLCVIAFIHCMKNQFALFEFYEKI